MPEIIKSQNPGRPGVSEQIAKKIVKSHRKSRSFPELYNFPTEVWKSKRDGKQHTNNNERRNRKPGSKQEKSFGRQQEKEDKLKCYDSSQDKSNIQNTLSASGTSLDII